MAVFRRVWMCSMLRHRRTTYHVCRRSPCCCLAAWREDLKKFLGFRNQCCLWFILCPYAYPTDQAKVGLFISLLMGSSLAWASMLLDASSPLLSNLEGLLQAISSSIGLTRDES
uniref:DUF4939 domain-containing protein n=1 Tax=Crocodylus porosus TaxID=8502 RepID=A0A7M4E181_CROPO